MNEDLYTKNNNLQAALILVVKKVDLFTKKLNTLRFSRLLCCLAKPKYSGLSENRKKLSRTINKFSKAVDQES
jgi:hypothetical protein